MASRAVFDPQTLLRMSPLLAATCTLWANIDHTLFLDFTPTMKPRPTTSPLAALFSLYEANTTALAAVVGAALNLVPRSHPIPTSFSSSSLSSSPAALGSSSALGSSAARDAWAAWGVDLRPPTILYLAGLAFTAAHFAVQPYLSRVVVDLAQAQNDHERRAAGRKWRWATLARAVLLDLPAWGCFLGAAMAGLRPL